MNLKTNWDDRFMKLAHEISSWSKDTSTKVGAVIVGPNNEIRSTGYNGFPRGVEYDDPAKLERPEKYFWFEHAERNALYNATMMGLSTKGCTLYCTLLPCMDCARGVVQCGITRVVTEKKSDWADRSPQWKESHERTLMLLEQTGVQLIM